MGRIACACCLSITMSNIRKKGVLCVKEGQKSLADKTGMCLKSINRTVKRLSEQGLIEKQGNKLLVGKQQYEEMKALISEKTDME